MIQLESHFILSVFGGLSVHPITLSAAISLLVCMVLLACCAIISSAEIAFFSLDPQSVAELEKSEHKAERTVIRLLNAPQHLLATLLISINFVNVAVILLLTHFTNTVFDFSTSPLLGFVFQTIIITFLLLFFGEVMPKIYAAQYGKRTALFVAPVILFLGKFFGPLVNILVKSTSFVNNRLARYNRSNISMDELSHALKLTSNHKDEDTEILDGIIKFGNIQVVDIMTSRVDMVDLDMNANFKDLLQVIIQSGYSRIPVYLHSRDNVKGVLYSKDLLPHIDKPPTFRWQSLIRPAYFVPETKKIDDLLNEFQENRIHLALVVDEYGGTSGLITLEDILEEIVGDISDEYDEEQLLYTRLDKKTYIFEAKIQLNDFFKLEGIHKSDFEHLADEVETLAGLILELKGDFPLRNEKITYGNYCFEIVAADARRIKKVKLTLSPAEDRY